MHEKSREPQSLLKKIWDGEEADILRWPRLPYRLRQMRKSFCNTHGREPVDTLRTFYIKHFYSFFYGMLCIMLLA